LKTELIPGFIYNRQPNTYTSFGYQAILAVHNLSGKRLLGTTTEQTGLNFQELISELHKKRQLTIMMITHEAHHIPSWVKKIIHIHHYKVVLYLNNLLSIIS